MDLDYAKIGFLFLVFAVVSGGYVTQVLSCQIQRFLSHSLLGKTRNRIFTRIRIYYDGRRMEF